MELIQIILIVFSLFAFSRAFLQMRNRKFSVREFFFWGIIWIGVFGISIAPAISGQIAHFFGINRGVDFLIYLSVVALFYFNFKLYVELDSLKQEITKLTRYIAIGEGNKNKKKLL